jgi:hypothetical protein
MALVGRSQSASIYWVAAIAPGPLPSYVTGLAPASPGHMFERVGAAMPKTIFDMGVFMADVRP